MRRYPYRTNPIIMKINYDLSDTFTLSQEAVATTFSIHMRRYFSTVL